MAYACRALGGAGCVYSLGCLEDYSRKPAAPNLYIILPEYSPCVTYTDNVTLGNILQPVASDYESEKVAGSSPAERAREIPANRGKMRSSSRGLPPGAQTPRLQTQCRGGSGS